MRVERQAVLEAATRLFTVNPRASTQEVAAAAGISRATLHRLFPSRDALIAGLGLLAIDRIREAYASARLDEDPVPEALARLITALVPVVHQFAYLVGETQLHQNDAVMAGDRVVEDETERLLRRGQAEGSLRTDLPVVWMAHTLAGLLLAAEEAVRLGTIAPRDASRLILESFLGGAGSRADVVPIASAQRGSGKDEPMSQESRSTRVMTTPLHLDLRDPAVRASIYATYGRLRHEEPVAPAILTVSDQDA